jgi:hyperosmotically inducible periplasmic protein
MALIGTSLALSAVMTFVGEVEVKMTRKLVLVAFALCLLAGTAAAGDRKDLQIANDISSTVNRYANFTIFDDVTMEVNEGVVTLGGKVTMPYKRNDIGKRVAKVEGVKEIRNRIEVLPVSSWDDELRYRIARAIYGNSNFWNYAIMANPPIHIVVEHGRVTLTGVVQSNVDRMLARSLATNFNAFSVTSRLKTDAEVRESLEKAD